MELLFIDESGDTGLRDNSSEYYILAGISLEDISWKEYFWKILNLRRIISQKYGIVIDEFKGSDFFAHRGCFFNSGLLPSDLEWIYNQIIELILDPIVKNFVIVKPKKGFDMVSHDGESRNKAKIFLGRIWREYMSIYERYLIDKSIKSKYSQSALIYYDYNSGLEKHIRKIVRDFSRKYDQFSTYNGSGIIEDVVFRDSKTSYLIQLADVLAISTLKVVKGKGEGDCFSIRPAIRERIKQNNALDFTF